MVENSTTQKICLESEDESLSLSTDIYARRDRQVTCGTPRGLVTPFKLEILQARTVVLEDHRFFLLSTPFCYLFLAPRGVSSILQKPFTDSLRPSDEDGTPSGKKIVQYKLGSPIQACDLTSRTFHADLHADLHDNENTGSAHPAPRKARLARISFNQRDPLQKIQKAVAPRDTKALFEEEPRGQHDVYSGFALVLIVAAGLRKVLSTAWTALLDRL